MNRSAWAAVAAAGVCIASISVSAHDDAKTIRDDAKTITVTGCVQNFSSTDTSGVTQRGFLLSNPTVVTANGDVAPAPMPDRDTSATGTPTGTSGTAAAGMPTSGTSPSPTTGTLASRARRSYRLDGHDEELKAQVGHKVEIEGAIQPNTDNDAKVETDRLRVSTIKMLASDCTK
jgi:hypothetical protein